MRCRTALRISRGLIVAGIALILAGAGIGVYANTSTRSIEKSKSPAAVQPTDTRDCGAVSLFVIARLCGNQDVTLDYVRDLCDTGAQGASLYALSIAAEHLGFDVTALELTAGNMKKRLADGQQAILHLDRGHFVSAVGVTESGRIVIVDGVRGARTFRVDDITGGLGWSGKAVFLSRTPPIEQLVYKDAGS